MFKSLLSLATSLICLNIFGQSHPQGNKESKCVLDTSLHTSKTDELLSVLKKEGRLDYEGDIDGNLCDG